MHVRLIGNKDEEPEVVKTLRKLANELEGDCLTMTILLKRT